jgi:hypothetical protein
VSAGEPMLCREGVAVTGTEMNAIEGLMLFAAFVLAGLFAKYFVKYLGWWATLPAVILGLLLAFILGAGIVRSERFANGATFPGSKANGCRCARAGLAVAGRGCGCK